MQQWLTPFRKAPAPGDFLGKFYKMYKCNFDMRSRHGQVPEMAAGRPRTAVRAEVRSPQVSLCEPPLLHPIYLGSVEGAGGQG